MGKKTPNAVNTNTMSSFYDTFKSKDGGTVDVHGKKLFKLHVVPFWKVAIEFEHVVDFGDATQAFNKPAFVHNEIKPVYENVVDPSVFYKFVQNMNLPNNLTSAYEQLESPFGGVQMGGQSDMLMDSNTFSFDILNTELNIVDYFFTPWLEEVSSNAWNYKNIPYATAKVYVDIFDSRNHSSLLTYEFRGCFPHQTQQYSSLGHDSLVMNTRKVDMVFQTVHIHYNDITGDLGGVDININSNGINGTVGA